MNNGTAVTTLKHYIEHDLLDDQEDAEIDADDNLLGEGWVDSIGLMSLVVFVENEFGVQVPPEDVTIEHFRSINTIATYLENRDVNA